MNATRLALATLTATLALSIGGYATFGLLFPTFYGDFMRAGSAIGVERQPPLHWAVALAMLSYGALVALAIERTHASGMRSAMTAGAVVGFLLWCSADFMLYGISNVGNLSGTIIEPLLEAVLGGIAGCAAALVLRRVH